MTADIRWNSRKEKWLIYCRVCKYRRTRTYRESALQLAERHDAKHERKRKKLNG